MSHPSETLRKLIVILFQAMIIIVPLTWTTTTSELFEFPKMLLVYAFTAIIVSLWLTRMIIERKLIWSRTFLDIPLFLFLISQVISTIFSINPHTSLYGYYSRFHGGLLSTISYLLLYYAAVSNLYRTDAVKLIKTLILSGVVACLYAFPEHFGHSPSCLRVAGKFTANCWVQDVQTRVFGTFGQPNWLAAYLISIFFLPLAALMQKNQEPKTKNQTNSKFQIPNIKENVFYLKFNNWSLFGTWCLYLGTLLLFFAVLLFTKSRSGLMGLALGFLIFWPLTIYTLRNQLKSVLLFFITCSLLLVTCYFAFGKGVVGSLDSQIAKIFTPRSVASQAINRSSDQAIVSGTQLEVGGTESGTIRRIVWSGAIDLWKMHPLFGSGVETFAYGYYNARPIEHNLVSEWDFLYNKAHNEFLNFLATTGLFGLISYLLIIIVFTIWSIKQIFQKKESLDIIALLSGFWALMVSNFFGFSTVPVGLLFFLYPALTFLLVRAHDSPPLPQTQIKSSQYVWLTFLFLFSFYLLLRVLNFYRADRAYARGKALNEAGDLVNSLQNLQKAFNLMRSEPVYSDELALASAKAALSLATNGKPEEAKPYGEQAITLSDLTLSHNKVHLNFWKTRARVFLALATLDGKYVKPGEQALIQAAALAPTDAKIFYNLASLRYQLGDNETAKKLYQKTLELKPDYGAATNDLNEILAAEATMSSTKKL